MQDGFLDRIMISPEDYPGASVELIEEFNHKIRNLAGVVLGLGKEYHTIWLVNIADRTMELYRNTGADASRGVIEYGLEYNNFDRFMEAYVDNYVVDRTESTTKEVNFDVVMRNISDGDLYCVDYMRMSDSGELSYYQMAFALAGDPGVAESFLLAFRDIDSAIKKHIADKRYLREQLDIVRALSRDYYNIFKIDINTGDVVILKLDGYVTKGMEGPGEKKYSYDVLYKQYVKDRVYIEDQQIMLEAISLDTIRQKLREVEEYVSSYRVLDKGEIHYYQFTYLPINPANVSSGVLAGFKIVDDIVESAREREALVALAESDIMTGILNRGSGEQKMIEALSKDVPGMMCIMDIDDFKSINDTYGHGAGDKVIRSIADIISAEFRENDIVFRLGGDEFAVYAIGVENEESGKAAIDRVFDCIHGLMIYELGDYRVNVSAGAVIRTKGGETSFENLYRQADSCVYRSKEIPGCILSFYSEQ